MLILLREEEMDNDVKYNHGDLVNKSRYGKQLREKHTEANSKRQLIRHVSTKIKTTMIGALDSFEKGFGYLWGHTKELEELTPEESEMRELWEEIRTEVLDKGNGQLRGAQDEISQYTLKWNKFHTEFLIKDN